MQINKPARLYALVVAGILLLTAVVTGVLILVQDDDSVAVTGGGEFWGEVTISTFKNFHRLDGLDILIYNQETQQLLGTYTFDLSHLLQATETIRVYTESGSDLLPYPKPPLPKIFHSLGIGAIDVSIMGGAFSFPTLLTPSGESDWGELTDFFPMEIELLQWQLDSLHDMPFLTFIVNWFPECEDGTPLFGGFFGSSMELRFPPEGLVFDGNGQLTSLEWHNEIEHSWSLLFERPFEASVRFYNHVLGGIGNQAAFLGEVSVETKQYTSDVIFDIPSTWIPELPDQNHTFLGWTWVHNGIVNTNPSAITHFVELDVGLEGILPPQVLYPIFERTHYPLSWDLGGGEIIGSLPQNVNVGQQITPPPDPTRQGYNFRFWSLVGAPDIPFDFSQNITSDMTFVAQWERIPDPVKPGVSFVQVRFVLRCSTNNINLGNQGMFVRQNLSYIFDLQTLPNGHLVSEALSGTGLTLVGWATEEGGTLVYTIDEAIQVTESKTLFAVYQ